MAENKEVVKTEKQEKTVAETIDQLVKRSLVALDKMKELNQDQVDLIVSKASVAGLAAHGDLAKLAVEDTGRGVFEDKATKNLFACEHVTNYMRDQKTVGIIEDDPVTGIKLIAEPVGVIAGLTPTTNPTSTAIFKSLISLKTRNTIIFSFHPSALESSIAAAKVIRDAAIEAGAPEDCILWVEQPSGQATNELMNHPGVSTILATGGNAMVKAAYSCGKPALGVGAGNVPAYIEKTANLRQAAHDIVMSKSFDNGMICACESGIIVDHEIYDDFMKELTKYNVYFANAEEKAKLEDYVFGTRAYSKDCSGASLNADAVGQSATWIAEQAGIKVPANTSVIAVKCEEVGPNEPMTREKLNPILAVLKADSTDDGIQKSADMVAFHGLGHSAAIHTNDEVVKDEYGKRVKAIRIICNSPSTLGGIGDVYNAFIPSLTLGCGSYGSNSVGDNVSSVHLLNIKKVGERRNNMQWFKVPRKIYFERNSIQYLQKSHDLQRVMIITDKTIMHLGYVQRVLEQLELRDNPLVYEIFSDVEADPDISTVEEGARRMRDFEPNCIIAIGGGSVMDAAKVMWLFYERPDIDFRDLIVKFMDIRKRAVKFPTLGDKAKLICIPTTSGTGAEVTPFAVISDKKNGRKYPITDYALLPSIAIIDPALVETVPASVAAATGMDVLAHALEAYVSTMASHYTDGLALQAIELVFANLEKSVKEADKQARENMHNASTIAGMAFGNAFLGIMHSMAHTIGGQFHTVHGETNAILMPYVVKYNGTKPSKMSNWPKYNYFRADEKYQNVARVLGLPASTPEEGVQSLADACYKLGVSVGIDMNFRDQKINESDWMKSTQDMAYVAYADQCTPANPRLAMVEDMKEIMEKAYKGWGEDPLK